MTEGPLHVNPAENKTATKYSNPDYQRRKNQAARNDFRHYRVSEVSVRKISSVRTVLRYFFVISIDFGFISLSFFRCGPNRVQYAFLGVPLELRHQLRGVGLPFGIFHSFHCERWPTSRLAKRPIHPRPNSKRQTGPTAACTRGWPSQIQSTSSALL